MFKQSLENLARSYVQEGTLELTTPEGRTIVAGTGEPVIRVRYTDPKLPLKLLKSADMAIGEAYMDGTLTIENDDLRGFIALILINMNKGHEHWTRRLQEDAIRRLRFLGQNNPLDRSRKNVAHHYDLSRELYDIFLDADRQYSCAYFRHDDDSLDQAQEQKKHHIAKKLLIEPGMEVLDIGCGWGGMALTLARDYGARVTGVTLSTEQHEMAQARAREAGLEDRVTFLLQDYRNVEKRFDRIVSVGMFEHVGLPQYDTFFRKVYDLLGEDGVALIHTIGRTGPPGITSPFIAKYIFPGGYVPALSELSDPIERTRLEITDLEVWRIHYAKTLRHWADRFDADIDKAASLYDERFCRMWRFYLIGSEQTFVHGRQVVFQAQIARHKQAVPITRDYMCDA